MKPIAYIILVLLLMGCEKEPTPIQIAVSTGDATNITTNSASIQVSMDKNDIINETGVLCSTDSLFISSTINKSSTQEITGTKFNFLLSNLSSGTKYFYKAYASGKSNSIYGVTKSFMTEQIQLSTSLDNIEANDKESTYKIKISSNSEWTVSSNQNWCGVSPITGSMQDSLSITIKENTTTSARQAIVTITAEAQTKKITINQMGRNESLSISSNYFSVSPENKSHIFTIQTNLSWSISSDQSWCIPSIAAGSNNQTISFDVLENATNQKRNATIIVKSGNLIQQIIITQTGTNQTLAVSNNSFIFGPEAGASDFLITSNTAWSISSNQSWCNISTTSGSNNKTISFSITPNTSTQSRTAIIIVNSSALSVQITVTQEGRTEVIPTLSVSPETISVTAIEQTSIFDISSNTDWTISSDQSWCTPAVISGNGDKTISCSISENTQSKSRTAIITVSAGSISRKITMTQAGKEIPTLSLSHESISVTANEQMFSFDISSNTDWSISSDQSWCIPAITSGNGDKTISCSVFENIQSQTRTATLTINVEGLTKRVIVTQLGEEVVNINIPDLNFKAYLVANYDTNKDGEISEKEALSITRLECNKMSINDLTGIEFLSNLSILIINENNIKKLNVSKNLKLTSIDCYSNLIETIDLSQNRNLKWLRIDFNNLTVLDVSNNEKLEHISCVRNKLTELNIDKNVNLKSLTCNQNRITKLNLFNNTKLTFLACQDLLGESLDISNNLLISTLICSVSNIKILYLKQGQSIDKIWKDDKTEIIYK